jgi:Fe-S-cluster formation regulator IscX/YfhJ
MGPYSEQTQQDRREAIQRLLDSHPDMDPVTVAMWQRHLDSIAVSEEEYNARVKAIYSNMKKGVIEYE